MDTRSLKHVVILARELNYTRAAQALHLTQSALSRSIQTVEEHNGIRLFDRNRGGVQVTAAGREFVRRAATILRELEDFQQVVRQLAQGESGKVSFGMAPLPARAVLSAILPTALADNPDLGLNVVMRNAGALLTLLLEEQIEFFLCAEMQLPDNAPLRVRHLGQFPLSLVVRPGHPLLVDNPPAGVGEFPVIAAAPFQGTGNFPPYIRRHISGPPQIVVEDYSLLVQIAEQSDALWPTSTFAISDEICSGRLMEIAPPPGETATGFSMNLYSLDRRTLSPAADKLIARFSGEIHQLASLHPPL